MLITKIFNVESSHRVVNCSSTRCKFSLHGHSAVIELTLKCSSPDNGGMVYDFGLMKSTIKEFIDSMDHCNILYSNDDKEYIDFIRQFNQRYITLPVSPSAEFLSAYIFQFVRHILNNTQMANGEGKVEVYSVKYHETKTGSATCFEEDLVTWFPETMIPLVEFSDGVINDWSKELKGIFLDNDSPKLVKNKPAVQQVPKSW